MLKTYSAMMALGTPLLRQLLKKRSRRGKEDPQRLDERMGIPGTERPDGKLAWVHAASVGEIQSALILVDILLANRPDFHILVTTGTVTSAKLAEQRLPARAIHQYYPLDHPQWAAQFLDHWRPDLMLWMESELWPNMLMAAQKRAIPAALINARLSPRSFRRWQKYAPRSIEKLLHGFQICLAQSEDDAAQFRALGARNVSVIDNLKYAATPLPCESQELEKLQAALGNRPLWLYASTHDGEEDIACRLHMHLQKTMPDLLSIIVMRHPERLGAVTQICEKYGLRYKIRGGNHALPDAQDQIYLVNTMGELGLFYRLCPLACIGRSFSHDGGGGHNPIEAAQLGCAVLHGPHVQNLALIYEELDQAGAAIALKNEKDFQNRLERLLTDPEGLAALQNKAANFCQTKAAILNTIQSELAALCDTLDESAHGVLPPQESAHA